MAKKGKPAPRRKKPSTSAKRSASTSSARKAAAPSKSKAKVEAPTATATAPATPKPQRQTKEQKEVVMPFGRMNYILMIVGVLIISLGFYLMSLDDFVDANEFSISLYIAPPIVIAGFLEIIYAIMYRPKNEAVKDPVQV
ncbi:MAG: DUF3098 domain-containing protein [Bacteroidota bacterium]